MLKKIATLGVKRTLLLSITVSLVIAGPLTAFFVNREVRQALERAMRHRGESEARLLAAELSDALAERHDERVAQRVEGKWDDTSFSYVIVLHADWTVAAKRLSRSFQGRPEEVVAAHTSAGMSRSLRHGDDIGFTRPVTAASEKASGGREERTVGYVLLGLSGTEL